MSLCQSAFEMEELGCEFAKNITFSFLVRSVLLTGCQVIVAIRLIILLKNLNGKGLLSFQTSNVIVVKRTTALLCLFSVVLLLVLISATRLYEGITYVNIIKEGRPCEEMLDRFRQEMSRPAYDAIFLIENSVVPCLLGAVFGNVFLIWFELVVVVCMVDFKKTYLTIYYSSIAYVFVTALSVLFGFLKMQTPSMISGIVSHLAFQLLMAYLSCRFGHYFTLVIKNTSVPIGEVKTGDVTKSAIVLTSGNETNEKRNGQKEALRKTKKIIRVGGLWAGSYILVSLLVVPALAQKNPQVNCIFTQALLSVNSFVWLYSTFQVVVYFEQTRTLSTEKSVSRIMSTMGVKKRVSIKSVTPNSENLEKAIIQNESDGQLEQR